MKIGLISDTHVPSVGNTPPEVARAFAGVDLILHAGDILIAACLDWLEAIAPVVAVENPPSALLQDPRVEVQRVIEVEGWTIGMVHDLIIPGTGFEPIPGAIDRLYPPGRSLPAALEILFGRPIDIMVFGHTHRALVEEHQGILFINPGSPALPNQLRKLGNVGILEIANGTRRARIVDLADFSE